MVGGLGVPLTPPQGRSNLNKKERWYEEKNFISQSIKIDNYNSGAKDGFGGSSSVTLGCNSANKGDSTDPHWKKNLSTDMMGAQTIPMIQMPRKKSVTTNNNNNNKNNKSNNNNNNNNNNKKQ